MPLPNNPRPGPSLGKLTCPTGSALTGGKCVLSAPAGPVKKIVPSKAIMPSPFLTGKAGTTTRQIGIPGAWIGSAPN